MRENQRPTCLLRANQGRSRWDTVVGNLARPKRGYWRDICRNRRQETEQKNSLELIRVIRATGSGACPIVVRSGLAGSFLIEVSNLFVGWFVFGIDDTFRARRTNHILSPVLSRIAPNNALRGGNWARNTDGTSLAKLRSSTGNRNASNGYGLQRIGIREIVFQPAKHRARVRSFANDSCGKWLSVLFLAGLVFRSTLSIALLSRNAILPNLENLVPFLSFRWKA